METELKRLRIDRARKESPRGSGRSRRWVIGGIVLLLIAGAALYGYSLLNRAAEVEIHRVRAEATGGSHANTIVLNATGYIVAAHKIQVASKVLGRVAWIGVDKGDKVREGQVIVRLEDDEYRAQLQQARGQLAALDARLRELLNGSRPEEIERARAEVEEARADLANARITLDRNSKLVGAGVLARQTLDDASAAYDARAARVAALEKAYELVRIGPRQEEIAAARGQVEQARGAVAFAETQLENTVIRAPVTGTILERAVEKGEFVTTSFVGERGAKGYVVSLADLRDLEVELDISQNDFAKLGPRQRGIVTTDAFPDRKYEGIIDEISPEANRQKATVQIKVKVLEPDDYLRPEMNASVAFYSEEKAEPDGATARTVVIPPSAIRDNTVFVVLDGKAVRRTVKPAGTAPQGVRIAEGLIGGEDLIINPPADLQDGDPVKERKK
ncbi:MAG: efflux RND transporter periplasmic adaptor subunit [Bryobacteraceae bacterium]|nr:efflux RND transporter periplasmic adaptor subunit [Bryobacterales bacterium]MEB2361650.1 efflux RND transporter periplasmic adaptor subunit [Bryobacterales bacterium]NUN00663.1 efflux RND transporter periplasmic adaptor subunit [Bryobacteraceae bacterium]